MSDKDSGLVGNGSPARGAAAFEGPLGEIGLEPVKGADAAGSLFEGDGARATGWYWSWSRGSELAVVACDFALLEDLPFTAAPGRYFAVRKESSGILPHSSTSVFLEAKPRVSRVVLPARRRFAYVEIEYFDDYCLKVFGETMDSSLSPLAGNLKELRGEAAWDPEIERLLSGISFWRSGRAGADLALGAIADGVMARLLNMESALSGKVAAQDRAAITAAIRYIKENLGGRIRQEDLLGVANMGATKFKRSFKQVTGSTATEFIASERVELAKRLLSDGEKSVEEVSALCGFEHATSFSALFSRLVGVSPRKWRSLSRVMFEDDPESFVAGALLADERKR